jgi:hypothetical protein
MRNSEIRKHQEKYKPADSMFWLMEIAAQVESMKRSVQDLARKTTKANELPTRNRRGLNRNYYAIEYVPSNPPKLDWIGRTKPRDGHFDHVISASSLLEAEKLLIEKLTAERTIQNEESAEDTSESAA